MFIQTKPVTKNSISIFQANSLVHAVMVSGVLQAAGIQNELSYETLHYGNKTQIGASGVVDILIACEDKEQAEGLLNITPRSGEIFWFAAASKNLN
jgi:hypothetical protein